MAKVMVAMYCFDCPDDYNECDEYDDGEFGFVSDNKLLNASLLCDKFRLLDLDTLIIDDYSFRDAVEIRDEIVNLHLGEVSEESLDRGYEYFNLLGCTQSFINSEYGYDKTGNLIVPDGCNFMPIAYKWEVENDEHIVRVDCCDEPVSLFVDVVDKKVEVCISDCIVSDEKLESEEYCFIVATLSFSYFENIVTKVSKDILEFGDTACILLNHKSSSHDIIIPNKYKKVCLDIEYITDVAFRIVIPLSVELVSLDRTLEVAGIDYYLRNSNLTLYFPRAGKTKNIIKALYKRLLAGKVTVTALISGFIDINSLVKKMKDEYNINIEFY